MFRSCIQSNLSVTKLLRHTAYYRTATGISCAVYPNVNHTSSGIQQQRSISSCIRFSTSSLTVSTASRSLRRQSNRSCLSAIHQSITLPGNDRILNHYTNCNNNNSIRMIQTEKEYIPIVTTTLQTIHDAIDNVLDRQSLITDYEISLSQGVLTLKFPPHGTWVINQQTPNLQIWWSSPLSGPKRFEYDDDDKLWFSTKDGLNLGHALAEEIHHIYPDLDPIDLNV